MSKRIDMPNDKIIQSGFIHFNWLQRVCNIISNIDSSIFSTAPIGKLCLIPFWLSTFWLSPYNLSSFSLSLFSFTPLFSLKPCNSTQWLTTYIPKHKSAKKIWHLQPKFKYLAKRLARLTTRWQILRLNTDIAEIEAEQRLVNINQPRRIDFREVQYGIASLYGDVAYGLKKWMVDFSPVMNSFRTTRHASFLPDASWCFSSPSQPGISFKSKRNMNSIDH